MASQPSVSAPSSSFFSAQRAMTPSVDSNLLQTKVGILDGSATGSQSAAQRIGVKEMQGESDPTRRHEANKSNNNSNNQTTNAFSLSAKKKEKMATTPAAPLERFALAPSGWDARKFQARQRLEEKALTAPPLLTREGINAFEVPRPHTFFKFHFVAPKNSRFSRPLPLSFFHLRVRVLSLSIF
jgi:hypothetical protein